jgi:hypothetical protein
MSCQAELADPEAAAVPAIVLVLALVLWLVAGAGGRSLLAFGWCHPASCDPPRSRRQWAQSDADANVPEGRGTWRAPLSRCIAACAVARPAGSCAHHRAFPSAAEAIPDGMVVLDAASSSGLTCARCCSGSISITTRVRRS